MNLEHANAALFAAMALAQGEVENAAKGSINPHFKSRYADLAEVLNTVRPVFAKHGLAIIQSTACDGQVVSVTTALVHKEGGYVTSELHCVPAKFDAQGIGSVTTYLRRYALAAMTGVAQEDDDGNAAAHNRQPQRKAVPPSEALAAVLELIAATQTVDELNATVPVMRQLEKAEYDQAVQAAQARKRALLGGAA